MSETNSDDGFSVATDATAAEASVNAHGSGIGEALRARVQELMADAQRQMTTCAKEECWNLYRRHDIRYWAFSEVCLELDAIEANAATDNDKAGSRSS